MFVRLETLKECARLLNREEDVTRNSAITGFSVDTRTLKPGEVYFALPGAQVDGHQFVEEAFAKGASCAVVANWFKSAFQGLFIRVDDVLKSLQGLAKAFFDLQRPLFTIGITGSLGKTTTKEFLATLLKHHFKVFKSPGNHNSQIGLPLALLNYWNGADIAILEMGMTEKGHISRLVEIAPPDIAVLTKVSLAHAQNFSSIEAIAEAKREIFTHPKTNRGIYAKEIDFPIEWSKKTGWTGRSFALRDRATDYSLIQEPFANSSQEKSSWRFKAPGLEQLLPTIDLMGEPSLHNLLAALSTIHMMGVLVEGIMDQIPHLKLPERRLERVLKKGVLFINDSYNASLDSMIAALKCVEDVAGSGKKWAVLGSMLELGRYSDECHRSVGLEALERVDHLLCFGDECIPMVQVWEEKGRKAEQMQTHEDIICCLRRSIKAGDVVLLKGSSSKMMWKVLDEF